MADELADMAAPPKKNLFAQDHRNTVHCFFASNLRYANRSMVKTQATHCPETKHLIKHCSKLWLQSIHNEQRNFTAPSLSGRPFFGQTIMKSAHA